MVKRMIAVLALVLALPAAAFAHTMTTAEAKDLCLGLAFQDSAARATCLRSTGDLELQEYTIAVSVAGESITVNLRDGDLPARIQMQGVVIELRPRPLGRAGWFLGDLAIHEDSASSGKPVAPEVAVALMQGEPLKLARPTGKIVTLRMISSETIQSTRMLEQGVQ